MFQVFDFNIQRKTICIQFSIYFIINPFDFKELSSSVDLFVLHSLIPSFLHNCEPYFIFGFEFNDTALQRKLIKTRHIFIVIETFLTFNSFYPKFPLLS